jgi:hypothetical protein
MRQEQSRFDPSHRVIDSKRTQQVLFFQFDASFCRSNYSVQR